MSDTVEVDARALRTVMNWLATDSALDSMPSNSDLEGALRTVANDLEDGADLTVPRHYRYEREQ